MREPSKETIDEVVEEYGRATSTHGPFHNPHEGYAVLLEEVDELWEAIRHNKPIINLHDEAVQIAAIAIRFIEDIC